MNWVDIPYSQFSYKKMPATSGVYRFYSTIDNTELYVGKAKKLCNRLSAQANFLKKLFNEFGDTLHVSYIITENFVKVEKESILKFKLHSSAVLAAILLLAAVFFSSCGMSSDSCEIAVREKYDGKSLWVKSMGSFESLVLTRDSVLLQVSSRSMSYPYISNVDTLGVFGHSR